METKEINIVAPQGYEIDKENSTFECIKFKPVQRKWRDSNPTINGWYLGGCCLIQYQSCSLEDGNYNVFNTKKQAKSAFAMAQISQIMANDKRFGGAITNEEWCNNNWKFTISRRYDNIYADANLHTYTFLAFHTEQQRDLFFEENEDLIRDYLMID